ncbi:MAG TPA: folylpolyglutamate synthase/dihydrofolate synthase family protein [Oscillospiraceae bacterium]|nr:folylpolyglutamate synthase/dihydrofolate synthase family protein [Oscillospiraceae bacterium]
MNCNEAIEYIHSVPRFPKKTNLLRITALMARLGNPQEKLNFVHIAGTNGKGSTAAMTADVLSASGYRTGLFTSPYLEHFRERFQIDRVPIAPERLAALTERVKGAADRMTADSLPHPNEFELVTAVAMLFFLEEGCDYVVLEVGLGGRFDATNVIPPPLAAAITEISYDHTGILGSTLYEIAGEKAGILKTGSRAVLSPGQAPEAAERIRAICRERGVPLVEPDTGACRITARGDFGSRFLYRGEAYELPLLGSHQVRNALTVIEILNLLRQAGVTIPQEAARRAIARVKWPGRMELLRRAPDVLLDAAHNPGGIDALCRALSEHFPGKRQVTVMGMMRDKDYESCITEMALRSRLFIATEPPEPGRALCACDAAEVAARSAGETVCEASLRAAVSMGLAAVRKDELLVVCGSIPLIGEARTFLGPSE